MNPVSQRGTQSMQPNVIDWTGRNTSSRLLVREIFGLSGACIAGACIEVRLLSGGVPY